MNDDDEGKEKNDLQAVRIVRLIPKHREKKTGRPEYDFLLPRILATYSNTLYQLLYSLDS